MSFLGDIWGFGPMLLANPWGALGLLGIPVVIVIHCFQLKSRRIETSTLFLLEHLTPNSREGRRFTWWRSSIPFWLQILCVLILTWLLLEPRWTTADAVQRIVVVLDSSLSMRAFSQDLEAKTALRFDALARLTPRTYWTVVETDPAQPTLYEGTDIKAMREKFRSWSPSLPAQDPTHALELARSFAPPEALVIFVTDRSHDIPTGVDILAVGEPIENCGLVGSRLLGAGNDLEWQVVVQNDGQKTAHRSWWIEFAGQKTKPQAIDLEPGHPQILKGKFPPGLDRLTVCLDGDRFSLDDRMPIVRPKRKILTVGFRQDGALVDLFTRLARTLPAVTPAPLGATEDMDFLSLSPRSRVQGDVKFAVILLNDPKAGDPSMGGPFIADDDPLNENLDWQGLIIQPGQNLTVGPTDHVLLWKKQTPLIFIHISGEGRQLVFNFNFPASNASRLPAFVLLIDRFVESVRALKKSPETRNVELGESLSLAASAAGGHVVLSSSDGGKISAPTSDVVNLSAPGLPGFFSVTQGSETLLTGAAEFADVRESDFRTATSIDSLAGRGARLVEMHASAETSFPLWLLLLGILLALNWRSNRPHQP